MMRRDDIPAGSGTPALRLLSTYLPPAGARLVLVVLYALALVAIMALTGYDAADPVPYVDRR